MSFFLRNVKEKERLAKSTTGTWKKMPDDDGYDEAFFFFLKDTTMPFEWLVYNVIGKRTRRKDYQVSAITLRNKMLDCGYAPSYLDPIGLNNYISIEKYLEKVKAILYANHYI